MQTSVSLQEPYSFSIIPIIVLIIIASVLVFVLLFLRELAEIEEEYSNRKIELRKAYQLISENIRLFIFEVTDITTQNYSLMEIKKLNIPNLYETIAEYYEPEFSKKPSGDFINSVNKARRIINEWN